VAINVLDNLTAEQIAAGEVIGDPASVVKELVENSLDAGAKLIQVLVRAGGKNNLTVIDDGCGIPSAELPLAFRRFATSKLSSISDLKHITSLGFRGEALASIAAVSQVTLTSRTPGAEFGSRISLAGGQVLSQEEVGAAYGTSVEVKELFYNTPARLKFLRSLPVESGRITVLLSEMALAHPQVSFVLTNDNKTILQTSGDGELRHVIGVLYGNDCASSMAPLGKTADQPGISLKGYLSLPHMNRASRRYVTFVVNGRIIRSSMLLYALKRGYGSCLPGNRYPVAVLHLNLPPHHLDVNVHPTKAEIRFQQTEEVKELVYQAAKTALQRPASPRKARFCTGDENMFQDTFWKEGGQRYALDWRESGAESGKQTSLFSAEGGGDPAEISVDPSAFQSNQEMRQPGTGVNWGEHYRLIGQFLYSYLVAQHADQLLLIDQHAAHERVIYAALATGNNERHRAVQLALPMTVDVPLTWREPLEAVLPLLNEAGFNVDHFGDNSYIIRSYPFAERPGMNAGAFYHLLEDLVTSQANPGEDLREKVLKSVACHRAIKANQPMSVQEMEQLLGEWAKVAEKNYCPHGRPAVVALSRDELDRGFKRRGGGRDGR
jgi:DNA mismatch repair protein MutL